MPRLITYLSNDTINVVFIATPHRQLTQHIKTKKDKKENNVETKNENCLRSEQYHVSELRSLQMPSKGLVSVPSDLEFVFLYRVYHKYNKIGFRIFASFLSLLSSL